MFIIIEPRDTVADAYRAGFEREGFACTTFAGQDFNDWLQSLNPEDLASIQCVILGEAEHRGSIASLIRSMGRTPIIALKEDRSLDETIALFDIGADDVVRKPAPVRELVARANAIWRRSDDNRQEFKAGRLTVHFDNRDPTIDGDPLELPRRERQILEHLVRHRKRRITKTQLFNAIYGLFNDAVDETVIEGHVSKLRKKLRERLGYDVIDTKRFAGYAFIGESNHFEVKPPAWLEQRRSSDGRPPVADRPVGRPPHLSLVGSTDGRSHAS